jgi:RIO kinase 1
VVIDLPQVVDVVGNPQGPAFLARDVGRIADWFAARGLPAAADAAAALLEDLCADLHIPSESRSGAASRTREGHTDRL